MSYPVKYPVRECISYFVREYTSYSVAAPREALGSNPFARNY